MSARRRMAVLLVTVLLVVGAALAWLQWPMGAQKRVVEEETVDRQERLDALRTEIEREVKRLQAARERQAQTVEEIRELEESLEKSRERIEELQREIGAVDGA